MENVLEPDQRILEPRDWDAYTPNTEYVDEEVYSLRMSLCKACPNLKPVVNQCLECSCIMPIKIKADYSTCPIGKW